MNISHALANSAGASDEIMRTSSSDFMIFLMRASGRLWFLKSFTRCISCPWFAQNALSVARSCGLTGAWACCCWWATSVATAVGSTPRPAMALGWGGEGASTTATQRAHAQRLAHPHATRRAGQTWNGSPGGALCEKTDVAFDVIVNRCRSAA